MPYLLADGEEIGNKQEELENYRKARMTFSFLKFC